jgi:hypothetical protein
MPSRGFPKKRCSRAGYGNDSRQTGPLSSRILRIARKSEFAFSVETRPQWLTQRRATDSLISLRRPVFSAFSATFRSLAWSRQRRIEVGFAARWRTPFLSATEWARRVLDLLALRRERGQCLTKLCAVRRWDEWPGLSRIVAISPGRRPCCSRNPLPAGHRQLALTQYAVLSVEYPSFSKPCHA